MVVADTAGRPQRPVSGFQQQSGGSIDSDRDRRFVGEYATHSRGALFHRSQIRTLLLPQLQQLLASRLLGRREVGLEPLGWFAGNQKLSALVDRPRILRF